jgi:hypothetical protein
MTWADAGSAPAGGSRAFDETLYLDEVFAVCDRFGLEPPVVFQGTGIMRIGDADRADVFDSALTRLAGRRGAAGLAGAETAFTVLAAPELLVSVQRQDATTASTFFVASAAGTVVEHRPLPDNMHRVSIVRSPSAIDHAIEHCVVADGSTPAARTVRMTPAQLLDASTRAGAGDLAGAATVIAAGGSDEAREAFLRALAAGPAAVQVTVLDRPAPGRLAGTVTAWLDAGSAGLWRVPATDLAPQGTTGIDPAEVVHREIEIHAVGKAELIEEITEGLDDVLRP